MMALVRFNLRRFLQHRARTLLSVSGIAIGAALVVAVLALLGSLTESVRGFVDDLAGVADLEVSAVSDKGFDETLFFEVERVPGVDKAIPVVRARAVINRRPVLILGVDERARALGTDLGDQEEQAGRAARTGTGGLFLSEVLAREIGAEPGGQVTVFSGAGTKKTPVAGVIRGETGRFNRGNFALAPIPTAQQLLGRTGKLDSIFVLIHEEADVEAVKTQVARVSSPEAFVDSPESRARQASSTTQSLKFGMIMGVIIALIVGGFLIFNTMSMAALERRRELATLRALGGRKSQLLLIFLSEAALLGLVGAAIGAAVGLAAAQKLVSSIPVFYASKLEVSVQLHVPPLAIPGALGAGVLASVMAAWFPGRTATQVAPAEAMRPEGALESLDQVRGVAWGPTVFGGLMMVAGFVGAERGSAAMGFVGMGAFMAGTITATYGLTHPLASITSRVASAFGTGGRLAAAAIERSPRRAWATSVAVVAGVGMVVAQAGSTRNVNTSVLDVVRSLESIDLYVSGAAGTNLATDVLLPAEWQERLATIPGVANVSTNTFAFVNISGERVLVQGIGDSLGAEPAMAKLPPAGRKNVLNGTSAVVSTRFSELFGVQAGETLEVPTPSGLQRIPIEASVPSFTWDRGLITIGRGKMLEWFGPLGVSDYLLSFNQGADERAIRVGIRKVVAGSPVPVYLNTGSEYLDLISGTVKQVNRLFDAMAAVVVGAATLAIFNALLISVLERRRELGILRALGTSRRQLQRMVGIEALALGAVGGLLGVSVGFLAHRAAIAAVSRQGGMPLEYSFVLEPALWAFAIGMMMALLGSVEPARRAGSLNVIEAIGYE